MYIGISTINPCLKILFSFPHIWGTMVNKHQHYNFHRIVVPINNHYSTNFIFIYRWHVKICTFSLHYIKEKESWSLVEGTSLTMTKSDYCPLFYEKILYINEREYFFLDFVLKKGRSLPYMEKWRLDLCVRTKTTYIIVLLYTSAKGGCLLIKGGLQWLSIIFIHSFV